MILRPFHYVECNHVQDAIDALREYGQEAHIIAGGTVLVPLMKHRILRPNVLVSLAGISSLKEIRPEGNRLLVGALATHRDVSRSPAVRKMAPLLAAACGRVASPTIRSMGTLGGNLCYGESSSDPSPALLALDARLHLVGPDGGRTVAVEDFFLGFFETDLRPGELLTQVEVPVQPTGTRWTYLKWTVRAREDKPLLGLAIQLEMDGLGCRKARLGLGGVAPHPVFLRETSRFLEGQHLTDQVIARAADIAAEEVEPIDDLQATGDYRRQMVRVWVRRKLQALVYGEGGR